MYLWEKPDWPAFTWDEKSLARQLAQVSREQGRLLAKMEAFGFDLRNEAHLRTLTEDVVKSSEIEGKKLERDQIRSSIARQPATHSARCCDYSACDAFEISRPAQKA